MYKSELESQMRKLLTEFFQEEKGNRVTSNNIMGFALKVGNLFEANKVEKKPDKNDK